MHVQVIKKSKDIIAHSHRSANSARELTAAQRLYEVPEKRLKTWTETRWWTYCDCLESIAANEGPINAMIDRAKTLDKTLALDKLTAHEFKICRDLVKVLEPTRALQKSLEGEKYVTISHVDFQVSRAQQKLALAQSDPSFAPEVKLPKLVAQQK